MLDRDHRKPYENPALGVLLCASKDREVVESALSPTLSPALVAEYQTQCPTRATAGNFAAACCKIALYPRAY